MKPTRDEIMAAGKWHHKVAFSCGVTVGEADAYAKYQRMTVGIDLGGKTVLDIGALCGMGTLALEEAGANVWACDILARAFVQFDLVKREFGIKASLQPCSVYEVATEGDVVFCGGLYYHLQYPRLGLEQAWKNTREVMLIDGTFIEPVKANGKGSLCLFDRYDGSPGEWLPQYERTAQESLRCHPTQECLELWIDALPGEKRIVDVRTERTAHNRIEWQVWRA